MACRRPAGILPQNHGSLRRTVTAHSWKFTRSQTTCGKKTIRKGDRSSSLTLENTSYLEKWFVSVTPRTPTGCRQRRRQPVESILISSAIVHEVCQTSRVRSEVNIEFNFPPKLRGARSRLYRQRFLQVNTKCSFES